MARVEAAEQAMIDALPAKTGRDLASWLEHIKGAGLGKHGAIMAHLKGEHGVTHGYANLIAQYALGRGERLAGGDDGLVESQYAGAKASLLPIYHAVVQAAEALGPDVEIAPKKTYVSLRRKTQFGLVQPTTRTRVDVGIKLPGTDPTDRLEPSGSFNSMVTHRVRVSEPTEVDAELTAWLKQAYDVAG